MNKDYYIKLSARIDESQKTITELNSQIKNLQNKVSDLEINVKLPTSTSKGFTDLDTQLKKLGVSMQDFNGNVLSTKTTFDTTTTRYTDNAGKMLTVTEKLINGQKMYKASLKEVNNAIETNAKQADHWKYSWSKAFQSFTTYMSVTTVFYQIINTTKQMIQEVTDLDSALVELQKVSTLTGDSLQQFVSDAYEAAEGVAKTGTEMINAATEFSKAGYDDSQILKLGELALMYTNIADEEVSAAESAEFMIAQMKAFNIEAEDAIHIIDAVNEVANRYAVSSADIANNLGKSSAVMANAGNSYEEMIGLLTAGTEITRNASKVSNGLKTITLRMQGMTDESEKSMELVAQMEELYSKLGISVYDANGELKNTFELLKTLAPIYQEATAAEKAYITETIAGKYQAQNAAAILNAINATETAMNSQGSAMSENEKVLDSIEGKISAMQSAFEQLSQNLIGSDLVKFFVDLGTAVLNVANSDFGQFIIKTASVVVGLKAFIAIVGGVITATSKLKNIFVSTVNTIGSFNNLLNVMQNTTKLVALKNNVMSQSLQKTKTEMNALGLATDMVNSKKEAQVAINNTLKASTLALNAALSIGAMLITGAISLYQSYQQEQQQAAENALSEAEELDQKSSDLDGTIERIKELRSTIDDDATGYSEAAAAREELNKIQKQLISDYGLESDAIDLTTGSIDKQIESLKKLREEAAQDWLDSNVTEIDTAKDKTEGKNSFSRTWDLGMDEDRYKRNWLGVIVDDTWTEEQKKKWKKYFEDMRDIADEYGDINVDLEKYGDLGFTTDSVKDSKDALEEMYEYLTKNKEALISSGVMSEESFNRVLGYVNSGLDDIKEKFGTYFDLLDTANKKELVASGFYSFEEELKNIADESVLTKDNIQTLIDKYPGLDEALENNDYTINQLIKDYQNLDNVYNDLLSNNEGLAETLGNINLDGVITEDEIDALKEKFPELQEEIENTGFSLEDIIEKFPDFIYSAADNMSLLIDEMNSLQEAYNITSEAMQEYNDLGFFSIDTLEQLLQLEPQYLNAIVDENGVIRDNISMFQALTNAKLDEMLASENTRYMAELNRLATMSEAEAAQLAAASINAHDAAMGGQQVNAEALRKQIQANIDKFDEEAAAALRAAAAKNEAEHNQKVSLIENTRSGLGKNWKVSVGGYTPKKSSSSSRGSSSSKSEKEWWEKELEALQDQFKYNEITIEQYINGLSNLLGRVQQGTDAWRKINEELQKQRLTKVEDDYKRGTISLDEYIAKLKELIKAYKQGTDAWNELADKIKEGLEDKLDQQRDDLETAEDAAISIIDKEIEKLEDLRDAEEERYDKLIEEKEKANEETERELELARLQEALENAKKEKTKRVWREGIGWVWEADQEAIKEAQDALDEFNKEQEISDLEEEKDNALDAIDDQIKGWEDYKEQWESVVDDYEFEQDRLILLQKLGAETENEILQQKIEAINRYKDAYLSTMKEIEELEKTSADKLMGYTTPKDTNVGAGSTPGVSGGGGSAAPSLSKGSYVSVKPGTRWYSNSYGGGTSGTARSGTIRYINNSGTHPYNIDGLGWVRKSDIVGYRHGGVVDYTGLAMLHGTKTKPEYVLNNDQMRNMLANFTKPQVTKNVANNTNKVENYNFGNIELPNVNNAQQFVTELKSLINITKHQ